RGKSGRRDRAAPVPPRHLPAARQSLFGADPAGDDLSARRFQLGLLRDRRRASQLDASPGDARHSRRLRSGPAAARRRAGYVGAAVADPLGDHPDAPPETLGGTAVTTTTADVTRRASASDRPAERMRRVARRWRYATNTGAAFLSVVLVAWTLIPLYNMVM